MGDVDIAQTGRANGQIVDIGIERNTAPHLQIHLVGDQLAQRRQAAVLDIDQQVALAGNNYIAQDDAGGSAAPGQGRQFKVVFVAAAAEADVYDLGRTNGQYRQATVRQDRVVEHQIALVGEGHVARAAEDDVGAGGDGVGGKTAQRVDVQHAHAHQTAAVADRTCRGAEVQGATGAQGAVGKVDQTRGRTRSNVNHTAVKGG